MIVKNLLCESLKKSLTTVRDNGVAQRCFDNARERFTIFHILNYIMYTEALNAFDKIEECGLMRHEVKRHKKMCDKEWERYQHTTRKSMNDDSWYLMQDYCMAAHDSIENDLILMRWSFHNYLLKLKCNNAEVISYLSVALKIADLILILWPKYFETYKRICGLDFTINFTYADMHVFIHFLKALAEALSQGNVGVDYGQDTACLNAMIVVENKMADDNFLDKAAMQALSYSDTYRPLYEKVLKEKQQ